MNSGLEKDMNTKTALQQSIAHWKRLEAVKTPEEAMYEGWGSVNCALCSLYYMAPFDDCGNECPVKVETGEDACLGTPYNAAAEALKKYAIDAVDKGGELNLTPITKMREFLESLEEEK